MKQEITSEQVFQLSEKQMNKVRAVLPFEREKELNINFVFVNPKVDYFQEIPQGEAIPPLLIPMDEIFPILNLGQCLEIIQTLTGSFPEYTHFNGFEVTLFAKGDMVTWEPQTELVDALWEVIKDITKEERIFV